MCDIARAHGKQLQRFFASRVSEPSDADDLVQETYLRLLRVKRQDLVRCPKAYIFRIAANLAHEHWLRRSSRASLVARSDLSPAEANAGDVQAFEASSPEASATTSEQLEQLATLLNELPPKAWAALIWAHRDGLSYKEISARLSVSTNMVKKYLIRALAACREGVIEIMDTNVKGKSPQSRCSLEQPVRAQDVA